MGINLGSTEISAFKLGSTDVDAIYLGSTKLWPTAAAITAQYLIIGGGGGGGYGAQAGGGGGAGEVKEVTSNFELEEGTSYSLTIGSGGANGYYDYDTYAYIAAENGENSSISGTGITTITALGGGGGATQAINSSLLASDPSTGGSGGGGGGGLGSTRNQTNGGASYGASGTGTNTNSGGDGGPGGLRAGFISDHGTGGGGGGAGSDGQDGQDYSYQYKRAGKGGTGFQSTLLSAAQGASLGVGDTTAADANWFASGGMGFGTYSGYTSTHLPEKGGGGGNLSPSGDRATGGGALGHGTTGTTGGSGVIIIKVPTPSTAPTLSSSTITMTSVVDGANTIYAFKQSTEGTTGTGTLTF